MDEKTYKVIICGGGTGGHVFPAIAIAQALQKAMPNIDILFVGAKGKLEMEKVPQAGFPIEGLWISGLQRRLTWKNLSFPFKLISSLWRSMGIINRFKPDVVIGVGGYASGPVLRVAVGKKVPSMILEQNSFPGLANRMVARHVQRICVAYDGMQRYFDKDKIILTGNPIRHSMVEAASKQSEGKQYYGLDPERPLVLLTGGSLGARSLNEAMKNGYDLLAAHPDVQWLWQCGKLYAEDCLASETAALAQVHTTAFLDRMDLAYAAADLVVARAGALTISELCVLRKAAILVPSPNVAEDHQNKNAKALVQHQAAIKVDDQHADSLCQRAIDSLSDESLLQMMRKRIAELAKPNADEEIAALAIELMKGKEK